MNKTEFIAAVAAKEGLEKKTAEKAVNAVIACIGDALASGDKIQIDTRTGEYLGRVKG